MSDKLKEIMTELNLIGNSIESTCCGLRFHWKPFKDKEKREDLIYELEDQLNSLSETIKELKKYD